MQYVVYNQANVDFTITGEYQSFSFVSKSRKERKRCSHCGTQFASWNVDKRKWSVWTSTVDKEGGLPDSLRATAHMFYGTRVYDAADGLSKWEGYQGESVEIK